MSFHSLDVYAKVAGQQMSEAEALALFKERFGEQKMNSALYQRVYQYDTPILKEHQLFGEQILMGVTHCALALEAAKFYYPDKQLLEIRKMMFFDAIKVYASEAVTVTLKTTDNGDHISFKSEYLKADSKDAILSASGEYLFGPRTSVSMPPTVTIQDLKSQTSGPLEGEVFYHNQNNYGPGLFTVRRVYPQASGVLGEIQLTEIMQAETSEYYIHPALIDGGYVTSLFAAGLEHLGKDTWVPMLIKRIRILDAVPRHCYCQATVLTKNQEIIVTDNCFYTPEGKPVMVLEGFSTKRVPSEEALGINKSTAPVKKTFTPAPPSPVAPNTSSQRLPELIEQYVIRNLKQLLKDRKQKLDLKKNFMDLGADSNGLIEVAQSMEREVGLELYPTLFFEYQNVKELSAYFYEEHRVKFAEFFRRSGALDEHSAPPQKPMVETQGPSVQPAETQASSVQLKPARPVSTPEDDEIHDIAVIGMAGRVAGSDNLQDFWYDLRASKDLVTEIPPDHWDYRPWFDERRNMPNKTYSKWGSFIKDIDKFDPSFFDVSRWEADWMDPQLRLYLEVVQETIEDAGYGADIYGTDTGVYTGVCFHEYWDEIVRDQTPLTSYEHVSSVMSMLSCRISYAYDLQGGSIPLDNACASSLTAMHLACRALQRKECGMAVVGGLNALLSPLHYVYFSQLSALSPTGRCHAFDKAADGYVPGEGVLALLLKPLPKAIQDGDNIHVVIKGSAVNHVGRSNNPAAPRPELQTKVILKAWEDAGIEPETITYLEAHGTGTELGDPIEVNALKKAFAGHTKQVAFCELGSAKAHIGHLEGAAGVASVIKVILSMQHGQIPAMPNFQELNPYVRLENSPFNITLSLKNWAPPDGQLRRAGVSSFGMTGNNAHMVLEEFPRKPVSSSFKEGIFILSAKTEERLQAYALKFKNYLEQGENIPAWQDCIYTLQVGREHFDYRLAIVCSSYEELKVALEAYLQKTENFNGLYHYAADTPPVTMGESNEDQEYFRSLAQANNFKQLASLWASGATIDWKSFADSSTTRVLAHLSICIGNLLASKEH